jgi:predicted RNase H-like nuclease (RuvC/YqgF family)
MATQFSLLKAKAETLIDKIETIVGETDDHPEKQKIEKNFDNENVEVEETPIEFLQSEIDKLKVYAEMMMEADAALRVSVSELQQEVRQMSSQLANVSRLQDTVDRLWRAVEQAAHTGKVGNPNNS